MSTAATLPAKRPVKVNGTVFTLAWVIILLGVWSLVSGIALPSPGVLPGVWWKLVRDEGLLYELGVSLRLNIEGILLSTVISVGLAYLSLTDKFRPLVLILAKWRFFGMTGFYPIFYSVFGSGHGLKVALLVFGISVFFLTSMLDVVANVTQAEFDQTRSLRMTRARAVWEIVVLGRADQTFDALRQNAAIGWMMLTMVEGLTKFEGGLGTMMVNESRFRNLGPVFAILFTVLFVGILQDQFIGWLKNVCCPHSKLTLEKK